MAARVKVEIHLTNYPALNKAFRRLEGSMQQKVVKKAAKKAMAPVLTAAKAYAPRDQRPNSEPHLANLLKIKSYTETTRKWGRVIGARVVTPTRAALGIPANAKGYYPISQEYGWTTRGGRHVAGSGYMRAALDSRGDQALAVFRREVARAVRKAWRR